MTTDEQLVTARITTRDIYDLLSELRAEMRAELREMEGRTNERLARVEMSVRTHEDIIQQLRGARSLVVFLIGSNVVAAIAAILSLAALLE